MDRVVAPSLRATFLCLPVVEGEAVWEVDLGCPVRGTCIAHCPMDALVQRPKSHNACQEKDGKPLEHKTEPNPEPLQVQCCGGGVRLWGSTRGPPRVEPRGCVMPEAALLQHCITFGKSSLVIMALSVKSC
jgi:hypothetical protein